jgi:PAS domain S-box-containing protein
MTQESRYKQGIHSVDGQLQSLRDAVAQSHDPELECFLEELSTCLEELRSADEELIARNQELIAAATDLKNQEKRYHDLFEFSPDGYVVTDLKGVIQEANLAAAKLLGVRRDYLAGKPIFIFLVGDPYNALKQLQAGDGGQTKVHKFEAQLRPRKGRPLDAEITASMIFESNGRQTGLRMLIRDVTDAKRKQQELERSRADLRALAARSEQVREDERNNLARELHDEFGAALTSLKLDLAWLTAHIGPDLVAVRDRIAAMSKLIDITTQAVSRTATMLRPPLLDDFGLVAAIEWQAQDFQSRTGIDCSIETEPIELSRDQGTAVFRIFQECLTNVARHAEATKITIQFKKTGGTVCLDITDNGKGIPEEKLASAKSFGLLGIRERAYAFGGNVKIDSAPNQGTAVRVSIPTVIKPYEQESSRDKINSKS